MTESENKFARPPIRLPERVPDRPRVFVSYSWDDEAHKAWVLDFATRLQENSGVQVILDRWYLRLGHERLYFMEQAVATSDFVVVIATPNYKHRADNRLGGAGYEAGAIAGELANSYCLLHSEHPSLATISQMASSSVGYAAVSQQAG